MDVIAIITGEGQKVWDALYSTVQNVNYTYGIDPVVTTILFIPSLIIVVACAASIAWAPQKYTIAIAGSIITIVFIFWLLYAAVIILNHYEVFSMLVGLLP